MCGICGLFNLDGKAADESRVSAARERIAHRGPDDAGLWTEGPVSLGFRRLSILDIEGGHQPMASADGNAVLVFNGEIYNHPELKAQLEASGVRYRTRSDTETILHLYERHGAGAFEKLNGMFAAVVWDRRRHELVLARDPIGVKPLYYALQGSTFLFASELRALLAAGVPDAFDPAAVAEYLSYGFVHGPRSIVADVRKLEPGRILRVTSRGVSEETYWTFPGPPSTPEPADRREIEAELERRLTESVRRQLLSDVPLGAFLSGGVDSSLVAALMSRAMNRPVTTFTIGFSGARRGLDESGHARKVACHLGSDHHEVILPADVLDRMEDLAPALDEPIADSAILPTVLLSRFAGKMVKVVLTGEGADELFAGYNRYKAAYLSDRLTAMPSWSRRLLTPVARRMGKGPLFERLPLATMRDWARAGAHCDRAALAAVCRADFLKSAGDADPLPAAGQTDAAVNLGRALAYDFRTVLCDALLMKVDKASMSASLEARVPFLDKALVEWASRLPGSAKMRRLKGKYLLRRIAGKYLPRDIAWRSKHGFVVPWEEWVRAPKSRAIDDMLAGSALESGGAFDVERLRRMRRQLTGQEPGGRAVDTGLFFRVMVLGLWSDSLKTATQH